MMRDSKVYVHSTKWLDDKILPHKRTHEALRVSPYHTTENRIDQICITKRLKMSMEDVRTREGADRASGTERRMTKRYAAPGIGSRHLERNARGS